MSNHCVQWTEISDYLSGKFDGAAEDLMLAHLTECEYCRDMASVRPQQSDDLVAMLKGKDESDPYASEPQLLAVMSQLCATKLAEETQTDTNKTLIRDLESEPVRQLGQYRLLSLLGEGGMGTVYRAEHIRLEMIVAVKVLANRMLDHPQAVARFEREMRAVGRINHPNIVKATDAGEAEGQHYLAMEFVDGANLEQVLKAYGRLRINDACEVIRQAALGMDHAHHAGLIHRDLKPSNLMLTREGQVKILDLGLARICGKSGDVTLTDDFQVMGTADYMAPEQALNLQEINAKADIYSLGCTLYTLLSGKPPFIGPSCTTALQKLVAHQHEPPPDIITRRADVPPELAAVLEQAMAKLPDERFASARELAEQLEPFATGSELIRLTDSNSDAVIRDVPAGNTRLLQATAVAHPVTTPPSLRNGRRLLFWSLLLIGFALLGLLIRFETAGGDIVVEVEGDRIGTQIEGEELVITDRDTGNVYRLTITRGQSPAGAAGKLHLATGKYSIQVANRESGLHLRTQQFEIRRFDKTVVNAYLENPTDMLESQRDVEVAEWVLTNGGDLEVFKAGQPIAVASAADLPQTPYFIHRIRIPRRIELTDQDFVRLAELEQLVDLNLHGVTLNDEFVRRLATVSKLQIIQLECSTIQTTNLESLKQTDLWHLSLEGPDVVDAVVAQVTELTQLTEFLVYGGNLTGQCVPELLKLNQLRQLKLYACNLASMELGRLGALEDLTVMELPLSTIVDADLTGIGALTVLESLNLEGTRISDVALVEVAKLPALESLNLRRTQITSAGIAALKSRQSLTTLDLRETRINDRAAERLAELAKLSLLRVGDRLSENTIAELKSQLPNCNIEWTLKATAAASQRTISEWALQQGGIVFVTAQQLQLYVGTIAELPDVAFDIRAINFTRPIELNDAEFDMLRVPPLLTEINFTDLELTDRVVSQLLRCSQLTTLKLNYDAILPDGLERLAELPNCTNFSLGGTKIGDAAAQAIKSLSGIRGLTLSGHAVTDESFAMLAEMKNITFLSLIFTRVTGRGLQQLEALPALDSLHLPYTQMTDEGLREVAGLHKLKWLNLDFTSIGDAGLQHVQSLPVLEVLELAETNLTDQGISLLRPMTTLRTLNISGTQITDAAVDDLVAMKHLTRLQIGGELSEQAVNKLREQLPDCDIVIVK